MGVQQTGLPRRGAAAAAAVAGGRGWQKSLQTAPRERHVPKGLPAASIAFVLAAGERPQQQHGGRGCQEAFRHGWSLHRFCQVTRQC